MKEMQYIWSKCISKIRHEENQETIIKFFQKNEIEIGEGSKIYSNIVSSEPYLIKIGNNVTISHSVDFLTHDNSVSKLFGTDHDLYGNIIIGDNCFIGAHVLLLYGVTLPDNVIVAAGSVVTKSPERGNVIIAGNPAKVIGEWDKFKEKMKDKEVHAGYLSYDEKKKFVKGCKERFVIK